MKNRNYAPDIAQSELLYTNATGSEIVSGTPLLIGKKWWVALATIAIAGLGTLETNGDYTFDKEDATDTWSQGDALGFVWNDTDDVWELAKWTPSNPYPPCGIASSATLNGDTTATVTFQTVPHRRIFHHVATAGEVSASNRVVIGTNLGVAIALVGPVIVRSSAGAVRVVTDLDLTGTPADVVELTVTSLAAGDLCEVEVVLPADVLTV